jgi:hypothetical protein
MRCQPDFCAFSFLGTKGMALTRRMSGGHDEHRAMGRLRFMTNLIQLAGVEPLARGGHRVVYPYPGNPGWCIKIESPTPERKARDCRRGWRRLFGRRSPEDGENRWEYAAYQELERRADPQVWRHIPCCQGWVETDLGRGLAVEWITRRDGTPAESFADRVQTNYDEASRRALAEVEEWLLRHRVRVGDLHPSNLVFGTGQEDGEERLFVIDGMGDRDILWRPYLSLFRPLKIRRKIRRMERRIQSLICKAAALVFLGILDDAAALAGTAFLL